MKKIKIHLWAIGILSVIYLICAYTLNIKMDTTYVWDYFFSSDCPRAVVDLQDAFGWHDRIKVHPLFLMIVQPFFQIMKGIFSSNENGRIILQSLIATLNCYGIYRIVYKISHDNSISILSMLIYGISFSTLVFSSVTETFLYATFCFILLWYYISSIVNSHMRIYHYFILIGLGVLCFSITITNIIPYSICVVWLLIKKSGLKSSFKYLAFVLGSVAFACVSLSILQKIIFPNVTSFYDILLGTVENEEVKYMDFSVDLPRILITLKGLWSDSLISPRLLISNAGVNMGNYGIKATISLLGIISAFIIIIGISIKKKAIKYNSLLLPLLMCIGFNFLLHLVYGVGYVFLYSAHWVFLIAILIGTIYTSLQDSALKSAYKILCAVLITAEALNNISKFYFMISKAQYRFGFFEFTKKDIYILGIFALIIVAAILSICFCKKCKNIFNIPIIICLMLIFIYSSGVLITRIELSNSIQTESTDIVTYDLSDFGKQIINFNNNIFIGNRDILVYEGFSGQIIQRGNTLYCNGDETMKESFKLVAKDGSLFKEDIDGQHLLFDSNTSTLPREYYFGMGLRTKYILYLSENGKYNLKNYKTDQDIIYNIDIQNIDTQHYTATGKKDNQDIIIVEDENGIYLYRNNKKEILDESTKINIPDFSQYKYGDKLSILFYEVMINITQEGPKPNFITYENVFYRDAALAAMVCLETQNMHVITPWINSIDSIYDHARVTVEEPDNLGQLLFLQSLVDNPNLELIDEVIQEAQRITSQKMLIGIVDGANHPIYATGWLKFGLESLGLNSSNWELPLNVQDDYADVLWFYDNAEMQQYRSTHEYHCDTAWQYLDYARAHFYNFPIDQRDTKNNEFPLSYEVGSNTEYYKSFDNNIYKLKLASPHIWGASEMYLYYINQ